MESNTNYQYSGQVQVHTLRLTSYNGAVVDLTPQFGRMTIYEDLFSNSVSGEIMISEGVNLVQHLPIIGQEVLEVEFSTPTMSKIKKSFWVYAVSDRTTSTNDVLQIYKLSFVSIDERTNSGSYLSKAYTGTTSSIAKTIYKDYFGKELNAKETSTSIHVIPAYWDPYQTLNWLCIRSQAYGSNDSGFIFYESLDGHSFTTIGTLASQKSVASYTYNPANYRSKPGAKDTIADFYNLRSLKIEKVHDRLDQLTRGSNCRDVIWHDMTTKTIGTNEYRYVNEYPRTQHVEKYPTMPNAVAYTKLYNTWSVLTLSPKASKLNDFTTVSDMQPELVASREALLNQISDIKLTVEILGDSTRRVGQIVTIKTPSPEPNQQKPPDDMYLSGRYLITSIKHELTSTDYRCTLELSKDSFANPIPDVKGPIKIVGGS